MTPKRKKIQDKILSVFTSMDKTGKNTKYYQSKFDKMSDQEFAKYMERIRDREEVLVVYNANMVDKLELPDLVKTAKDVGVELFERIRMYDTADDSYYYTPHKMLILQCPIRRMAQFVDHKLSVAEGDSRIDMLSGQVVKPDQAASLSESETRCLYARGLTKTLRELLKFRGGDVVAFAEFKRELEETGTTTVDRDTGTKVRSAVTLDVLYSGILIESNASGL